MGANSSVIVSKNNVQPASECPMAKPTSECPMAKPTSECPMTTSKTKVEECPVGKRQPYKNSTVFNVYSQKIDPSNQMPTTANQDPSKDQSMPLPVERVASTIPKGGTTTETWTYPSAQMFWNALVRKNKTEGVSEKDIDTVIAIHNNMNEGTWRQVIHWEDMHEVSGPGREPKLLRFIGRPDELSPKARLKVLFGHPEPFDRHDWVVDRGGREVRYIIDYYHDESAVERDQRPKHLQDMSAMQSIQVDVRPALDSVGAVVDRVFRMPLRQVTRNTAYSPPPFFPPKRMLEAEQSKIARIAANWRDIQLNCEQAKVRLADCSSDEDCQAASVALHRCTAGVVCPSVVAVFDSCVQAQSSDLAKTGAAYSDVVKCLEMFEIESRKVMAAGPADSRSK